MNNLFKLSYFKKILKTIFAAFIVASFILPAFLPQLVEACHYTVSGVKFNDENGNGTKNGQEVGLEGWTITLVGGQINTSTSTDDQGNYAFSGLLAGTYTVCEEAEDGWNQTYPTTNGGCHVIELNVNVTGKDFGNQQESSGSITVCKIIIDSEGVIVTDASDYSPANFHVHINGEPTIPNQKNFHAQTFSPDTDLFGDIEFDAECETYDNLPLGNYYYDEETITPSLEDWETPLYNDQNNVSVNGLGDFFEYNEPDNTNSDGHIILSSGRLDRTLVVLNQHKGLQPMTIYGYKVVCEAEEYLPNWATNPNNPPQITATTAIDYVNNSEEKCWLEADWEFQWGFEGEAQKQSGEYIGAAPPGTGWYDFDSATGLTTAATVQINDLEGHSNIWVRENLKEGYVPFTCPPQEGIENDVSAEILCHIDGYKYDNYDYVNSPELGENYYCVAFNAPLLPEGDCESHLIIDINYFANYDPEGATDLADMSDYVYVGNDSIPYGQAYVAIPLTTSNRTDFIVDPQDSPTQDDVSGIHVQRGEDQTGSYVEISSYGFNHNETRESIKAGLEFVNASMAQVQNGPNGGYEKPGTNGCGITEGSPQNDQPGNDEYDLSVGEKEGSICSITNVHRDRVRVYYNPTLDCEPPLCGNAILEDGEECEINYDCCSGYVCNNCSCEEIYQCTIESEDWNQLDRVDIGDTESMENHNAQDWWDDPGIGSYGGRDEGETIALVRDGGEENECSQDTATASFELGGGDLATTLTVRHLDGLSDLDSFDVYVNGEKIGTYTDVQDSEEIWTTTYFSLPEGLSDTLSIDIVNTDQPWSGCSTYGQLAFNWAEVGYCGEPPQSECVISGMKFNDLNENGINDEEPGLEGWTIQFKQPIACEEGEEWADGVIEYIQGTRSDGSPIDSERTDSTNALGEAQYNDTLNFVSLGLGGVLILGFDNLIINDDGNDIEVVETSYGSPSCSSYPEKVHVYASQYSQSWEDLGVGCLDSEFDLGLLPWAQYVKLIDETNPDDFNEVVDGFDVDGVKAINCLSGWEVINSTTTDENGNYCFGTVEPGSYRVEEVLTPGWMNSTPLYQDIEVLEGEEYIIDFGNYISEPDTGTLFVIKEVVGGTATAGDFTIYISGNNPSLTSFPGEESPGTMVTLGLGVYSVTESTSSDYIGLFSADCAGTMTGGETKTCTITNSFDYPPYCGDEVCNGDEDCSTCPQDCGSCGGPGPSPRCGDGICNGDEDNNTCCEDCGSCGEPEPSPYCGDGIVNGDEECDGDAGVSEGYICTDSCFLEKEICAMDLNIMMIMDISGSMGNGIPTKLSQAQVAANNFIDNLRSNDQSGLVSFSWVATLNKNLSNDHASTQSAINGLIADGATNIGDAINEANQELMSIDSSSDIARIEILLTDGRANQPNGNGIEENPADLALALNGSLEAAENGIIIFTIGLGDDINTTMLQNMAQNTGGKYYFAPTSDDLDEVFNQISTETCKDDSATTTNLSVDIFNAKILAVSGTDVTVSWLTNIPATSRVVYDTVPHPTVGDAPDYGYAWSTPENDTKIILHTVTITELTPGANYYWRPVSHGSGEKVGEETSFFTGVVDNETGGGDVQGDEESKEEVIEEDKEEDKDWTFEPVETEEEQEPNKFLASLADRLKTGSVWCFLSFLGLLVLIILLFLNRKKKKTE